VWGPDWIGRDVVKAYGACRLPLQTGRFVKYISTFAPQSPSLLETLTGFLTGSPAEFLDTKFVCGHEGRHGNQSQCLSLIESISGPCEIRRYNQSRVQCVGEGVGKIRILHTTIIFRP